MSYAIEISNLSKIYKASNNSKEKKALEDVNLRIKKGSFFGLLGPNGAGKSTIINILAGLVVKTNGQIKIGNIDMDENPISVKYKIGIVPQEIVFDPFFSVFETLEIYAGYYGVKKEHRRTKEIITALGLLDKANTKPRSLSGGMKRRLLVAKALVHNPDILVLDEPTAGVDVELRNQLWQYVKKLNKDSQTTILLTTHYLEEAEELCDEIAVINHGKVIACDKKDNLMKMLSRKEIIIAANNYIKESELNLKIKDTNIKYLDKDKISITYDPDNIEVEQILKAISATNIQIKDISTKQPDLEEIFKFLVQSTS